MEIKEKIITRLKQKLTQAFNFVNDGNYKIKIVYKIPSNKINIICK